MYDQKLRKDIYCHAIYLRVGEYCSYASPTFTSKTLRILLKGVCNLVFY